MDLNYNMKENKLIDGSDVPLEVGAKYTSPEIGAKYTSPKTGIFSTIRAIIYNCFAVLHTLIIYLRLGIELKTNKDLLPYGSRIMEVGPGTGMGTQHLVALFEERRIEYQGIDLDPSYTSQFRQTMWYNPERMQIIIGDFLATKPDSYKKIDILIMIECMMLIPELQLWQHLKLCKQSNPKLRIVMAHTEFEQGSWWTWIVSWIKPWLYWITTMSFGRTIIRQEFLESAKDLGQHKFVDEHHEPGIIVNYNIFGNPVRLYCIE